jgi:hypothetical protein
MAFLQHLRRIVAFLLLPSSSDLLDLPALGVDLPMLAAARAWQMISVVIVH